MDRWRVFGLNSGMKRRRAVVGGSFRFAGGSACPFVVGIGTGAPAAVLALGEFKTYAGAAIPSVVRELSDPDKQIRAAATNCLYMIETDFLGNGGTHWGSF